MIILYAVPISLWPMLGKENRYFYTRHPNNNDRWLGYIINMVITRHQNIDTLKLTKASPILRACEFQYVKNRLQHLRVQLKFLFKYLCFWFLYMNCVLSMVCINFTNEANFPE